VSDTGTELGERERAILDHLGTRGASFFGPLHDAVGGGYPAETVDALWNLVWHSLVTNDTFHALRAFTRAHAPRRRTKAARRPDVSAFRSRRLAPPSAEGRWGLVGGRDSAERPGTRSSPDPHRGADVPDRGRGSTALSRRRSSPDPGTTKWAAALTQQLLARHGVLTREAVAAEAIPGGFGIVYPVLKGLEENGRIRRGYFVAGLGATQFAMPGALDLLRSMRDAPDDVEVVVLAATDPANPYGATLKWPPRRSTQNPTTSQNSQQAYKKVPAASASSALDVVNVDAGRAPTRSVGATVILVNGALAAYLARGDRQLVTFLPDAEPDRSKVARAIAHVLIDRARTGVDAPRGMLLEEIDGAPPSHHPMAPFLADAGFIAGALGFQATFRKTLARQEG
jgi:ATP-dependent Lhr-like helicase